MKLIKSDNNQKIIDNLCQLVYERKFKQAETTLLKFIQDTVNHADGMATLNKKKKIIADFYFYFNCEYNKWLKDNKINIDKECQELLSNKHSNYIISHATSAEEMDDLIYDLISFKNSQEEKREMRYNLKCYKMVMIS